MHDLPIGLAPLAFVVLTGCEQPPDIQRIDPVAVEAPDRTDPTLVDVGVDPLTRTIRIGALNDESGPAAEVGRSIAAGKRMIAAAVNAGDLAILPPGWRVELVERDHGYNINQATQAYGRLANDVLFIGTSFGTQHTLSILPQLEKDGIVAFPASSSSRLGEHELTPLVGPSWLVEAGRAFDWAMKSAEEAGQPLRPAIVYQADDYGYDVLNGWQGGAIREGIPLVAAPSVAPGQPDLTTVVQQLRDSKATHVMLATLPGATEPILETARQIGFDPVWIGASPSWSDSFFDPAVLPPDTLKRWHLASGMPFWGEPLFGMDPLEKAWEKHGERLGVERDHMVLGSAIQALVELEVARRAIGHGDLTRQGYRAALHSIRGWDAGGLIQPLSLDEVPYEAGRRTRVLAPDLENRSWVVVGDWAEPEAPKPAETTGTMETVPGTELTATAGAAVQPSSRPAPAVPPVTEEPAGDTEAETTAGDEAVADTALESADPAADAPETADAAEAVEPETRSERAERRLERELARKREQARKQLESARRKRDRDAGEAPVPPAETAAADE